MDDSSQFSNGLSGCIHNKWHYFKENKMENNVVHGFLIWFLSGSNAFSRLAGCQSFQP